MKPAIVFSDIDGTLIHDDGVLSQRTISAVKSLSVLFSLITARPPQAMTAYREQLGSCAPMAAFSGGLVYGPTGELWEDCFLSRETALQICRFLAETFGAALSCHTYSYGDWLADDPVHPWAVREAKIVRFMPRRGGPEQLKPGTGVHKLFCMGEPELLDTVEKELEQKLEGVLVNRAGKHHLEFSHLEAVKAEAVRKICRRLGLKLEQAMAFGDSGNDLGMLRTCGYGYLTANARPEVKAEFPCCVPSNNADGVAWRLEQADFQGDRRSCP